jgi:RNA polymerase sigma factor for flagellar operon FliA
MSYANTSEAAVNECIVKFAPLVKRLAHYMMASLPPSVELDDVIQSGMLGLLDAARRFQDGMGAQFETYAVQRIRGAMLDEIRRASWAPRSSAKLAVEAKSAEQRIANRTGSAPSNRQVAEELGLSVERYETLRGRNQGLADSALEDGEFASEFVEAEQLLEQQSSLKALKNSIESLQERDRLIIELYYHEELTLKEIGAVLSISESRVSQLLTALAGKLRASLKDSV